MKKYLIYLFCILFVSEIDAQIYFNRDIDHNNSTETGNGIIYDSGYYYSHYMIYGSGNTNGYGIIKLDSLGNTIFDKFYFTVGYDALSGLSGSFIKTLSGDLVACGDIADSISGQTFGFIISYNKTGDTLYTRKLVDSVVLYNIAPTHDSGYVCTGFQTIGNERMVAVKFDKNGNLEWINNYGGSNINLGVSIRELSTGSYLISGVGYSFCGIKQHYLIKISSNGSFKWQKCYPASYPEGGTALSNELADGNFYISGGRNYSNFTNYRPYIAKIDSLNGDIIWQKEYGIPSNNTGGFGPLLVCDDNTIIAVAGYTDYVTVYKLTSTGDSIWRRENIVPSPGANGYYWSMTLANGNELVAAGRTEPSSNVFNVWIHKLDEWGCDTLGCEFLSVKENKMENGGISIYPNPSSDYAYLEYDDEEGDSKLTIELFSIEGKILHIQSVSTSSNLYFISLTNISSGSYFVKVSANNEIIGTKKLMVVK